jgi:hypothetical protein
MQVSATLIAAQQAAREARTRLAMPQAQATPKANFASALQDLAGTPAPKAAAAAPTPGAQPAQPAGASGRMGQHINILV